MTSSTGNTNGKMATAGAPLVLVDSIFAGVDWLTVTVKDEHKQRLIFQEMSRLFESEKEAGNVQRQWRFKGYVGWSVGGYRWGNRPDSAIAMLSGEAAALNWPILLAWCDNCTRLDLAVTVNLIGEKPHLASEAYGMIKLNPERSGKRKYNLVVSSDGGETLYVGSRASDQYGRFYDKGAESRERDELPIPNGAMWRYEVEFKSYRAKRVAAEMLDHSRLYETVNAEIAGTVYKWFLSRDVPPIFHTDKNTLFSTETFAKVSDDDVTLRWLSTQVAPSVKRLKDGGKMTEVLDALGISSH